MIEKIMTSMMIAQFKAGSLIMKHAWSTNVAAAEEAEEKTAATAAAEAKAEGPDAAYFVGLTVFAVAVVGYTMIGGFLGVELGGEQ